MKFILPILAVFFFFLLAKGICGDVCNRAAGFLQKEKHETKEISQNWMNKYKLKTFPISKSSKRGEWNNRFKTRNKEEKKQVQGINKHAADLQYLKKLRLPYQTIRPRQIKNLMRGKFTDETTKKKRQVHNMGQQVNSLHRLDYIKLPYQKIRPQNITFKKNWLSERSKRRRHKNEDGRGHEKFREVSERGKPHWYDQIPVSDHYKHRNLPKESLHRNAPAPLPVSFAPLQYFRLPQGFRILPTIHQPPQQTRLRLPGVESVQYQPNSQSFNKQQSRPYMQLPRLMPFMHSQKDPPTQGKAPSYVPFYSYPRQSAEIDTNSVSKPQSNLPNTPHLHQTIGPTLRKPSTVFPKLSESSTLRSIYTTSETLTDDFTTETFHNLTTNLDQSEGSVSDLEEQTEGIVSNPSDLLLLNDSQETADDTTDTTLVFSTSSVTENSKQSTVTLTEGTRSFSEYVTQTNTKDETATILPSTEAGLKWYTESSSISSNETTTQPQATEIPQSSISSNETTTQPKATEIPQSSTERITTLESYTENQSFISEVNRLSTSTGPELTETLEPHSTLSKSTTSSVPEAQGKRNNQTTTEKHSVAKFEGNEDIPRDFRQFVTKLVTSKHQVGLLFDGKLICSGTMVFKEWILTSADCFSDIPLRSQDNIEKFKIWSGLSNSSSAYPVYDIKELITYKKHVDPHSTHYLALVRLTQPAVYSTGRASMKGEEAQLRPGDNVIVPKWDQQADDQTKQILIYSEVQPIRDCLTDFSINRKRADIPKHTMCSLPKDGVCTDVFGAGVYHHNKLVGVSSKLGSEAKTKSCTKPIIFTSLTTSRMEWIFDKVLAINSQNT